MAEAADVVLKKHKMKTTSRDISDFVGFLRHGSPGPNSYVILLGIREFDSARLLRSVEQ